MVTTAATTKQHPRQQQQQLSRTKRKALAELPDSKPAKVATPLGLTPLPARLDAQLAEELRRLVAGEEPFATSSSSPSTPGTKSKRRWRLRLPCVPSAATVLHDFVLHQQQRQPPQSLLSSPAPQQEAVRAPLACHHPMCQLRAKERLNIALLFGR